MTARDFVIENGWQYIKTCMCKPPMQIYTNPSLPLWEIRVDKASGNTMQIREKGRVVARAGLYNYKEVYNATFVG